MRLSPPLFERHDPLFVVAGDGIQRIEAPSQPFVQVRKGLLEFRCARPVELAESSNAAYRVFVQDVHVLPQFIEALINHFEALVNPVETVLNPVEAAAEAPQLLTDVFEPLLRHRPLLARDDDDTSSQTTMEGQGSCRSRLGDNWRNVPPDCGNLDQTNRGALQELPHRACVPVH
jgi:hypothetical protein